MFAGPSMTALKKLGDRVVVGSRLATTEIPVAVVADVRFVVACRAAYSGGRDDIAVDFIGARCR